MGEESAEPQGQENGEPANKEHSLEELLALADDHNERGTELAREATHRMADIAQENVQPIPKVGISEGDFRMEIEMSLSSAVTAINAELDGDFQATLADEHTLLIKKKPSEKATAGDPQEALKDLVQQLQEMWSSKPGAPKEEVISQAVDNGHSRQVAEELIQRLRDKGEIYAPDQDHLRLV